MAKKRAKVIPKIKLSAFAIIVINFVFNKSSYKTFKRADLDKGFYLYI